MKTILKYLMLIAVAGFVTVSCEYDETNFDSLTTDLDANATYYVQFSNASQSEATGVALNGDLIEIETTVAVTLMGTPRNEAITVNFNLDPSSTIESSMYTLSASSITIPAGQTAGSVNFTTVAANMPAGESVIFALNLDAGDHNSPSENGTKLVYNLTRMEFCPLVNGSADLAGTWSVTSDLNTGSTANPAWYTEDGFSAVANGADLDITGIGQSFIAGFWGEPVVSGGTITMEIAPNGLVNIPRQYIYTTTWSGALYDYEIAGSGTWANCGNNPTLSITYDIYYPGAGEGLATNYAGYLNGPTLGGSFILN